MQNTTSTAEHLKNTNYMPVLPRIGSLLIVVTSYFGVLFAQPFTAPCPAPDSVVAMYQDDADRLALARTFRNGTTWVDSVSIAPDWSSTAMNALLAVYNSNLPERDTVVDMLNINVFPIIPLRSFIVSADSDLPWMQQLALGNVPTGTSAIDQLISMYELSLTNYYTWPWGHTAVFTAQANSNVVALSALFAAQPGVSYAEPNGGCCDGSTITDSVYTDHVRLVYSYGWGDCPSGCTLRRYWEFSVYLDCSVIFNGSWGAQLPAATQMHELFSPVVPI